MQSHQQISHRFGGVWTEIKLKALSEYLWFFQNALKEKGFETWYIDAFAGTGDRTAEFTEGGIFEKVPIERVERVLDGSARKALQINPPFDHYWFAEQHKGRAQKLEALKKEWPHDIQVRHGEANTELRQLFSSAPWAKSSQAWRQRGIVFLDPYGMSVDWQTLQMLASTKRVDVWYLFPRAAVIHQLAKKLTAIDDSKRRALERIFGSTDWEAQFYSEKPAQMTLFGIPDDGSMGRHATTEQVAAFARSRFSSLFCYVSDPIPLIVRGHDYFELYCLSNNKHAVDLIQKGVKHVFNKYRPASRHRSSHLGGDR